MNFNENDLLTAQDAMNLLKIEQLDYSVVNTTDVSHIKEIYLKSKRKIPPLFLYCFSFLTASRNQIDPKKM